MGNIQANSGVTRKIKTYLTENGIDITGLNDEQISELYWKNLSETISSSEKRPMDIKKAKDLAKKEKDTVITYVDGEPVQITDEGEVIGEDEIMDIVYENQNPLMSKSELIMEIKRQLLSEDDPHDDIKSKLDSGENDYAKHLDPESVKRMGQEIYDDIKRSAEQKFGGRVNLVSATRQMTQALINSLQFEAEHKRELEQEAINLVRQDYNIPEDAVDIEAEITGHPELGGRSIQKGNVQYTKGTTPPPRGKSSEELEPEVTKRRLINGMTHGAARKGQNLYHLAGETLRRMNPNIVNDYSKLMAANDFMYWAMDDETIANESEHGTHAGNSRVIIQENGKPKIIAQGMTFPFLLHELVKGVMELMSLHGTNEDNEVRKYVEDKTDNLEAEPWDIRLGVKIWEKVSQFVDIENPQHKSLFYHMLVKLPANQFNELIKGLVRDDRNAIDQIKEIADEASEQLRQEAYDEATGKYNEDPEHDTPNGSEEEDVDVVDPELDRLLNNNPEEETEDEVDYSNMSRRDLEKLMDDALDNNDFELASIIGEYLK